VLRWAWLFVSSPWSQALPKREFEPASVLLERIQAEKAKREAERKAKKRSRGKEGPRQLELL
jgi:hypothetical protein